MRLFDYNQKRNFSILIVDDNQMILKFETHLFQQAGCQVFTANNGLEALQKIDNSIDLVLTDIEMPEMCGDKLASIVNQDFPHIPIVGITSLSSEERQQLNQAYFRYLLAKPLLPAMCFQLIEEIEHQKANNSLMGLETIVLK